MKSYFIERLSDPLKARQTLSGLFPSQQEPWVLRARDEADVVAYLDVYAIENDWEFEGPYYIQVDVSGRHYNEDDYVLSLLRKVQNVLGGVIKDDSDNLV